MYTCVHFRCTQVYSLFFFFSLFWEFLWNFPLNRYTLHTSLHIAPYTPHPTPAPYTIHPAPYTRYTERCLLHLIWAPYTPHQHPTHHTKHPLYGKVHLDRNRAVSVSAHDTSHPTPHTPHPTPRTLHHTPRTIHPLYGKVLITPDMRTLHPTPAPYTPHHDTPYTEREMMTEREQLE